MGPVCVEPGQNKRYDYLKISRQQTQLSREKGMLSYGATWFCFLHSIKCEGSRRNWVRVKWPRGEWGGDLSSILFLPAFAISSTRELVYRLKCDLL